MWFCGCVVVSFVFDALLPFVFFGEMSKARKEQPWAASSDQPSVSDLVHKEPTSRLSNSELLRFERVIAAADATADAVFESRKRQRQEAADSPCTIGNTKKKPVSLTPGDDDDNEDGSTSDTTIARALINTIAATTGVSVPDSITTAHQAISWASTSIINARNTAITATRRERYKHALDTEQTVEAMKLIGHLNNLLDGSSM